MREGIHPDYQTVTVTCSCGHKFETCSTKYPTLQIEICSNCHPFYTGQQRLVDAGGRVDKFMKKYGKKDEKAAS